MSDDTYYDIWHMTCPACGNKTEDCDGFNVQAAASVFMRFGEIDDVEITGVRGYYDCSCLRCGHVGVVSDFCEEE